MDRALAIEFSADMAFFRRGYTTTSTLSYTIPPKTVIAGLIAGMAGKRYNSYSEILESSRVAVVLLNRPRRLMVRQNLLFTTDSNYNNSEKRTRVIFQYLRFPKYRVYFYIPNDFYGELKKLLEKGESVYTPYLGTANCIASVKYLGEVAVHETEINGSTVSVSSIIPLNSAEPNPIDLKEIKGGFRIMKERIPASMDADRIVRRFVDVLFLEPAPETRDISYPYCFGVSSGKYWEVEGASGLRENVIFF